MNKLEGLPKVHCISLEESGDRRSNLQAHFLKNNIANYEFHIFKRVCEYNYNFYGRYVDQLANDGKGCITSHLKALKKWYDTTNEDYVFVVEDDISFDTVDYWNFTWNDFIENLPQDWNAVQLIVIHEGTQDEYAPTRTLQDCSNFFGERQVRDWSSAGYIARRNHVKSLLDDYLIDDNSFKFEVKNSDWIPVVELLLFANRPGVYSFPLFVEDTYKTKSTLDLEKNKHLMDENHLRMFLKDGQGVGHHSSYEYVIEWWQNVGCDLSIKQILTLNDTKKLEGLPTIHYISLEESVDRRTNLENWFKKYNITNYVPHLFKRFEEYDHQLTGPYVDLLVDEGKGSITSHLSVLREWYETTEEPCIFVVEDDLSLETVEYWNFTWKEFENNLPSYWNCIQLVLIREDKCEEYFLEKRLPKDWCAAAYLIKREYVKTILDRYYFSDFFNLNIDGVVYAPIIELLLYFTDPDVYCFPLFVEDIQNTRSTFKDETKLINGQGEYHYSSYLDVINWWKTKGHKLNADQLSRTDNDMNDYQLCLSKAQFNMNKTLTFIDIGCNINDNLEDFTDLFLSLYPNSKCIGVEPVFYEEYENKWKNDYRVTLVKNGLSDSFENKIMYTPSIWTDCDSGLSSLYKRKIFDQKYKETLVKCVTLDILCYKFDINYIDYLKIDTEGSELDILKGSKILLEEKKINFIQVEYGGTYDDAGYTASDVIEYLNSYDYELIYKTTKYWNNIPMGEMLFSTKNNYSETMEFNFKNLKSKYGLDITGIIHVGAHYGEEVEGYVESGVKDIVLFEPISDTFDILYERVKNVQANITAYNIALGSSRTKSTMFVSDNEKQSSSLLKPKVHLSHHPNVHFVDTEEVEVDILDNYNCENCNYLHMDVQGYELEVLKGATQTLNKIDYVYCEVNRDELYEGNAYVQEIDEFLSQYGMKRVETSWIGDLWGDALYIKGSNNS